VQAASVSVVSLPAMKTEKESNSLYIKNMVCNRCITAVKQILNETNIGYQSVSLGEVLLAETPSDKQMDLLRTKLTETGFQLLDDDKAKIIAKIKGIIIDMVHYKDDDNRYNLSAVLSAQLHRDYSFLSRLFSEVEGITIEKYSINQKIEKIKELLVYDEINLKEIAFQMGYSSVAHLSAQFKKITGLSPSYFKKNRNPARKPLDAV